LNLQFRDDCLVSTRTGVYRGIQTGDVQVFKGIRYALPPSGELRFRPPVPVPRSTEIFDARSFSPVAPQPGRLAKHSGADSLSLNIWRHVKANGRSPVFFYVHGGSFTRGSGRELLYDGTILARDQNIVVVTINYRLGAFGFLDFSFLDDSYIANPALHDLVLALRWTSENIEAFGGDPEKITVAGQSSGGSLVSVLPFLDGVTDLFSRLILSSAIPTSFVPAAVGQDLAERFLVFFRIKDSAGLRRLTDKQIIDGTPAFMRKCGLGVGTFRPVIDDRYLKAFPIDLLRRGRYQPVPMLIGTTRDELSLLEIPFLRRHWKLDHIISDGLSREADATRKSIRLLYEREYRKREARIQLLSDMIFRSAALFYAEAASAASPVWLYRFDLRPVVMRLSGLGAVHSSDLPLIFGNLREGVGKLSFSLPRDRAVARKLSREIQADLASLMEEGTLPWARAFTDDYIAKCYDLPVRYDQPIPQEIYHRYRKTAYYAGNIF